VDCIPRLKLGCPTELTSINCTFALRMAIAISLAAVLSLILLPISKAGVDVYPGIWDVSLD